MFSKYKLNGLSMLYYKTDVDCFIEVCEDGTFGPDCMGVCRCGRYSNCDHVTGECICQSGHRGRHCSRGRKSDHKISFKNIRIC